MGLQTYSWWRVRGIRVFVRNYSTVEAFVVSHLFLELSGVGPLIKVSGHNCSEQFTAESNPPVSVIMWHT